MTSTTTTSRRQQNTNLFKQLLFLLLILNYVAAKTLFDVDDICECGHRCVGFGAKHCVRCCTTVMRRSVPLSEYPMEQLKEAATIKNIANTEEEKQQNDLIEKFVKDQERKMEKDVEENNNDDQQERKLNQRLEKKSNNFQLFIPSILLDRAYLRTEEKNGGQIVRRRRHSTFTNGEQQQLRN
ncbi:unnamed protein product [Meloidogyne enterolobii]|uniref:Uncharacterized protein n=1 Tax=Meloidogyne enterolobii TaxID=390850 RepID=A0ACB1AMS3_MELEN